MKDQRTVGHLCSQVALQLVIGAFGVGLPAQVNTQENYLAYKHLSYNTNDHKVINSKAIIRAASHPIPVH